MDTRQARTSARLRAAILGLAGDKPVDTVSVAELCRAAGITRDTFYRFSVSPVRLLVDHLRADLDAATALLTLDVAADTEDWRHVLLQREQVLLRHVDEHRAVYRTAMTPRLNGHLRDLLVDVVEQALGDYLDSRPSGVREPRREDVAVAYAAAGTVGAIEAWLDSGHRDVHHAAELVLQASNPWWWERASNR